MLKWQGGLGNWEKTFRDISVLKTDEKNEKNEKKQKEEKEGKGKKEKKEKNLMEATWERFPGTDVFAIRDFGYTAMRFGPTVQFRLGIIRPSLFT